jgi:hypothetical protein
MMSQPLDLLKNFFYVSPYPMKKEIKKQHPTLDTSIIDVLAKIDPSKTNKYLPFLIKQVNSRLDELNKSMKEHNSNKVFGIDLDNYIQLNILLSLIDNNYVSREQVQTLQIFNELLEQNRIIENDITKYTDFDQIQKAIDESMVKYEYKNKERGIAVLVDNDDYLIIRPLTYEASKKYGANTKWCTASNSTSSQFYEYTQNGILAYVINKKTYDKTAIHIWINSDGELRETTFWNAKDARIDSMESGIESTLIRDVIHELKKVPITNYVLAKNMGLPVEELQHKKGYAQDGEGGHDRPIGIPADPYNHEEGHQVAAQNQALEAITDHGEDLPEEDIFNVDTIMENPCREIPLEASNDMCRLDAPLVEPQPGFLQRIRARVRKMFRRKKNILMFSYQTYIDGEGMQQIGKNFENSPLAKDYNLIVFGTFEDINFERIAGAQNGENISRRG